MDLFKGYVPTQDKKCLMPFKGKSSNELKTYRQVKNLNEFAGILGEETILIDIDDYEQSEIVMRMVEDQQLLCRVYETTKGKHFLFQNSGVEKCRTGAKLACGITADIKVGVVASYAVLKFGGKEREVIYDIFEDEEYGMVPRWLFPLDTSVKTDFLDMESGDGRNQALYNYILTLQSNDFSVEESREAIRMLNKFVLHEPLEDEEIETILRDESFQKPIFFKGKTLLIEKFATYLKNNSHIIKINNQLHIYDDGIYVDGTEDIEREMIKNVPGLNRAKRADILSYINLLVKKNTKPSDANLIAFKNGIYNMANGELIEFSADVIITNRIPHNYNPDAYCEIADNTLNQLACNDADVRALLEECIGYTFFRRNELRKSFILIGDKANGKSTYLDMIKSLLGEENTCSLDLREIGDRFKTAELFGKLANIGDDIGDEFIANPAMFKKVVSGESVTVERKGQDPFKFNPYSKLLFSANNIPRIKDKSGAVIDRLVIIPFNATFSRDMPGFNPWIKYDLRKENAMEYLIKVGIEGLQRVLENRKFTISKKVEKELEEYEENNNPILMFFKENEIDDILNQPTRTIYKKYTEFCIANSFQPMSNIEFSKQAKKHYGVEIVSKSINSKKYRLFIRKETE